MPTAYNYRPETWSYTGSFWEHITLTYYNLTPGKNYISKHDTAQMAADKKSAHGENGNYRTICRL